MNNDYRNVAALLAGLLLFAVAGTAPAQDAAPAVPAPAPSGPTAADEFALDQSHIADKYVKLEQLMLKMAELEGLTNPKRAQLLTRAVQQSKEPPTKTPPGTLDKPPTQK